MANHASEKLSRAVLIAAALSDSGRVRILHALQGGELCACQLTELIELAPSTVSRHLSLLRQAGLLTARRSGRWIHFSLADAAVSGPAAAALDWCLAQAASDPLLRDDARRLKRIRRQDIASICGPGQ